MVSDNNVSEHYDGIVALGAGNTLRTNIANSNQGAGIAVDCPSLISENTAVGNGRVNIDPKGTGCRTGTNLAPGPIR